jgi:tRNA A37 threonylcarbamoyladenosine synthetase subunit TsaC/SUA5/YrdC
MDTSTLKASIIPEPGAMPNVKRDALEAHKVVKFGGVIIVPTDVGYGMMSASAEGIERALAAKQRKLGHTIGIIGTWLQHSQFHILSDDDDEHNRRLELSYMLTQDLNSTVAIVASLRANHPRLQQLSALSLDRLTKNSTLGIAIPEGPFLTELGRLNAEDGILMVGSSANLTG